MNKIKVLMVGSETTVKGGMTTVVNSFLNHNFLECEITYIPTHYNCGVKKNIIKFFLNIRALSKAIKENDIIHMHMSERGSCIRKYIIFKLAKKKNKKIIIHTHGAEFKEYFEESPKYIKNRIINMLSNVDLVLTLGRNWNYYIGGLDKRIKSIILRNSVKVGDGVVSLKEDSFNILFLAVLEKRKGIYDFIEVAERILSIYKGKKKIKFLIAGDGQEYKKVKELVNKSGKSELFEFFGWINGKEKDKIMKMSHLFVLPSYNEGLPMSILEAMSYGLPIVSTNVGSIDEAVLNNINGFLVNPGDKEMLENRISEILENEELWRRFSSNSYKIIEENFNLTKYFKDIEKIYVDIIG